MHFIQAIFNSLNFPGADFGLCSGYLRGVPACTAGRKSNPMCDEVIIVISCFAGL